MRTVHEWTVGDTAVDRDSGRLLYVVRVTARGLRVRDARGQESRTARARLVPLEAERIGWAWLQDHLHTEQAPKVLVIMARRCEFCGVGWVSRGPAYETDARRYGVLYDDTKTYRPSRYR